MPKCDYCEEDFAQLENWGAYHWCAECAKEINKDRQKPPRAQISDIIIDKPEHGENAMYNPENGETELKQFPDDGDIERVINHEFMHFILHGVAGLRYCYLYDCIKNEVDPYHSLR